MYVVIVCTNCQGASQVEETLPGQIVQCPLCGKPTAARTKEAVLPVARPVQEEPLSLDDAPPPLQSFPKKKRSPLKTALLSTVSLLATLALMGAIYVAFCYFGNTDIPNRAWVTFAPPEGHCTIVMPGDPEVEDIPADGNAMLGGKRFVVKRWLEHVEVGFGWVDFNVASVIEMRFEDVVGRVREREMKRLQAKSNEEPRLTHSLRDQQFEIRQFQFNLEQGQALLQVYFDADPSHLKHDVVTTTEMADFVVPVPTNWDLSGPLMKVQIPTEVPRIVYDPNERVRLYFAYVKGKKLSRDTPWVTKFFKSFKPG